MQSPSPIPFHLSRFNGGQSDYEDRGIAGAFKSGYGLDIRKQKDTLTCQYALVDDLALGNDKITAACYVVVPASDGNTYFFCYNGDIVRRNAAGTYLRVAVESAESGHIIGACEWYDNAGYVYLLWATPTRLNIKRIIGPGYTNVEPWVDVNVASTGSWPKTNLTSASFHNMTIANGALQITNKNLMALVGYDLSYTNESLALIPDNEARVVIERGKYAVIGCRNFAGKDESSLFDWDGIGLSWNDKQIIKFGGLNSMIDTEIAIAQIGTNGQLYVSDFITPIPFRQIRGGGESLPDGITSYHGLALIGIFNNTNNIHGVLGNGIYSIGRVNKNAPITLNLEYQLTCDEIYSVKTVGTDILVVYRLGAQYGVKIVDSGTYAPAVYQSLDLVAPLGSRSNAISIGRLLSWKTTNFSCAPLPPGCYIEVWYKIDNATTGGALNDGWIQANMDIGSPNPLQFDENGKQEATFYIGEKSRILETMIKLFPSGNRTPEIDEINNYFNAG